MVTPKGSRYGDSCVITFMFSENSDSVLSREQACWRFGEGRHEECDRWRGFMDSGLKRNCWNVHPRAKGSNNRRGWSEIRCRKQISEVLKL